MSRVTTETILTNPSTSAMIQETFDSVGKSDLDFILPRPTDEGVAELQAVYYATHAKRLDEDTAREVLAHLLSLLWNIALINLECFDTHSTQENLTTSGK